MIKIHVWGSAACFTRPELKVERVSYDVITPSAARGVLEAIHWKPAFTWRIDRITVLNPIRFASIRRNEVTETIPSTNITRAMQAGSTAGLYLLADDARAQRSMLYLKNVAYVIEASVVLTAKGRADRSESVTKHVEIARRRASKGQCFHKPCMGVREFAADFALVGDDEPVSSLHGEVDLGWMLHDIDFNKSPPQPRFFRASMRDGVIDVPAMGTAA